MLLSIFILFLWYNRLLIMTMFEKSHMTNFVTLADLNEIGTVNMKEMGTIPFFSIHYKGHQLQIHDQKHCAETNGDCFAFASKYLKITWKNAFETKDDWDPKDYKAHICSAEEIT